MKLIMNLTQIFRRIAQRLTPRHFGLLTGIFCIIGLFSALQLSSSFLLNASLNEAQRNEQQNLLAWQSLCGRQAISLTAPGCGLCRIKRPDPTEAGTA